MTSLKFGYTKKLSVEELSIILNISEFTVRYLVKTYQLPCGYENQQPYFDLQEVMGYFSFLEEYNYDESCGNINGNKTAATAALGT